MGLQDLFIGKLKSKTEEVAELEQYQRGLLKTFSFTSVGGGSGSSTLLLYAAQYLAKDLGKQVVILDLNFLQPDILYNMKVEVLEENSILNYLKGSSKIESCYVQDEGFENLKLVTTSPNDDVELLMNLSVDSNAIGNLIEKLTDFDFVLINLPYVKSFSTFIETVLVVDKGYLVLDDRLSNIKKADELVTFVHKYMDRGNVMNHVVLNKRSKHAYPYESLDEVNMKLVTEVPYDIKVVDAMNTKAALLNQSFSKDWFDAVGGLIEDILD